MSDPALVVLIVPAWALARLTSFHDTPAPNTLSVCVCEPLLLGPSEAANAISSSPGSPVLNPRAHVVPGPRPCVAIVRSTIKQVVVGGGLETIRRLTGAVRLLLVESVAMALKEWEP